MFKTPQGKEIFVVDGHTHFWDGSPANQRTFMASSSSTASTPITPI